MFGENYLIGNGSGKTIFRKIKGLPVLDAHNHADVTSLAKNESSERKICHKCFDFELGNTGFQLPPVHWAGSIGLPEFTAC